MRRKGVQEIQREVIASHPQWNPDFCSVFHNIEFLLPLLWSQLGVYKWVVDDVTKAVREEFLNEGVDTQMLEDLKQVG